MDLKWLLFGDQETSPFPLAARLLLPFSIAFVFFLSTFLMVPAELSWILGGLMILYFVPPAGKESVIPIGIALGIPWWLMVMALSLLDVLTGLFMLLNFGIALRIPRLGPWISRFLASGDEFMKKRPWLARWRMLGVAFFVFLPFQGTGGVGATIVGMMVGLSPGEILLAIAIGGTLECVIFALGFELIYRLILTNPYLGLGVAAVVIFIAVVALLLFRKMESQAPRE
jgi:uncharacterized membrane protein